MQRRRLAPLALVALWLAAVGSAPSARADAEGAVPPFLRLLDHGSGFRAIDPEWRGDAALQRRLDAAVHGLDLGDLAGEGKLGIALVDLADVRHPRLAEVNGSDTLYAASVPKIGVLYAAFQARQEGRLVLDDAMRGTLGEMVRVSSNTAASAAIQALGFNYINSVLWQSGLYDPEVGGGLWLGKAYGGENDRWHRDPVANTSHAANAIALAALLTELAQGELVDAQSSREMLDLLGDPGLHHKFVRGLDARPGSRIFRKSGTWAVWHGDAALVERGAKRYVAVALCESQAGSEILERLIVALDDCVPEPVAATRVAAAQAAPPAAQAPRAAASRSAGSRSAASRSAASRSAAPGGGL